jgi:hypothetical protein
MCWVPGYETQQKGTPTYRYMGMGEGAGMKLGSGFY